MVNYLSPEARASSTGVRRAVLAFQYEFLCKCALCRLDDKQTSSATTTTTTTTTTIATTKKDEETIKKD
jgi:hypothetical protein